MYFHSFKAKRHLRKGENGYVLLVLLLIFAMMAISATTVITSITFDIKREREEEMIHRGVQYARAIRLYYRKFGRYPLSIDDLLTTNQMRFLRRRYKDPLTRNDFKVLHFGDVKILMGGAIGGGLIPGASVLGTNGSLTSNSGLSPDSTQSSFRSQSASTNDTNDSSDQSASDQPSQTLGGGPIVGVASANKGTSIREFDQKRKYNEWQFIYTPMMERVGLIIKTPFQAQQLFEGVMPQPTVLPGQTTDYGTSAPGTAAPTPTNGGSGNNSQPQGSTDQQL